jgi:hypothetical protein
MRKTLKPVFFAVLFAACFVVSANAAEKIGINDLINNAETYDKQTVTVEGEAIGEVLERGDYAWVNINDGTNAIGIWMPEADAKMIEVFGDYKRVGDTLQITGVFSRSCTEHGGDLDIHCTSLEIVKNGYMVKYKIPDTKVIAAAGLLFIASAIAYVYFKVLRKIKS